MVPWQPLTMDWNPDPQSLLTVNAGISVRNPARSETCLKEIKLYNAYYGIKGCGVFKRGVQNKKDFCLKINILKGKYFKNWVNGEMSKS